jgi:glycine/D-amino acid oxidase-like deaminating enzyme
MEKVDVLIVGQGLSGTWLGWWLYKAGLTFKIIDQSNKNSASRRAAGLINPVTGRRIVTTWMVDQLIPFANNSYREIGEFLNGSFVNETSVIDFFPSVQMLQAFQKRYEEDPQYLVAGDNREKYSEWFLYDFGWGCIQPCFLIQVEKLLSSWQEWLVKDDLLIDEIFDVSNLRENSDGIYYSDICASYIIFCDGRSSAQNPYFEKLPFALNKGEGMLVEIPGLPDKSSFKKGMSLIPYGENIFWLGSSYEWEFSDEYPSEKFRENAERWLNATLKLPYKILEHFAAIRPATLERRPFVGFHPGHLRIGILNGMGTKGCSLAPYFAYELVKKIKGEGSINPLADVSRFERILTRLT